MRENASASMIKIASGLNLALGIWLIVAPFVLRYATEASPANDVTVGVIIAVLAAIRVFEAYGAAWVSWLNVALGTWLLVAPFILTYSSAAALWNDLIVGLLVICLGVWSAGASRRPRPPIQ